MTPSEALASAWDGGEKCHGEAAHGGATQRVPTPGRLWQADLARLTLVPKPNEAAGTPAAQVRNIDLPDVDPALHGRIRTMPAKHEAMWSDESLRDIKNTEHRIELTLAARRVHAATRHTGPRTSDAEVVEVKRMRKPTTS